MAACLWAQFIWLTCEVLNWGHVDDSELFETQNYVEEMLSICINLECIWRIGSGVCLCFQSRRYWAFGRVAVLCYFCDLVHWFMTKMYLHTHIQNFFPFNWLPLWVILFCRLDAPMHLKKYILLIMLLQLSHFPPSLPSALHTPSHLHSPPLVHVHGSYI